MTLSFKAVAYLVGALIVAPPGEGVAQSPPPSPPTQQQTEAARAAKPQSEPPSTGATRERRTKKKSKRRPSSAARKSLRQTRTSRAAEPVRRELTVEANLLGGYDDNLTAGSGMGQGNAPMTMASGSTESLDATLGYFRGNTARAIRIASTGNVLAYPDYLKRPAAGGIATIDASTKMGQAWTLRASERVAYEPFFNVFSLGASPASLPAGMGQPGPTAQLFEHRSRSSFSMVSVERQWTRRDSAYFSYSYGLQRFTAADRGDNNTHGAGVEYRRRLTFGTTARAAYGYARREYTDYQGSVRPIREHRLQGGPDIEKTLARHRSLKVSIGAGAGYVESIGSASRTPYHAWMPIGSASANLALSQAISVEGGYARSFSLLQGLTDEVYATDTAFLSTHLLVTSRTDVSVGASFSNWKTTLAPDTSDRLRVYGASLQLSVPLTDSVAATAGYFYYQHRYSNPGRLPVGFPAAYDRQAFRVGLTMRMPLMGTQSSSPLTAR